MTVFPALVVPRVPEKLADPKKMASLLLGRESPLMFYVLRMARPQFFVVFRQLKHRQQVVQSPGFKETVSRYGLTVSNARYCKDAETLQEEDFEGYEENGSGSVCLGERGGQRQKHRKQEGGGQLQNQPCHASSSPLGRGQTARRGVERRLGSNRGSAWWERCYTLPLEDKRCWEASAKRYGPDCPRREQSRGRGRVSGGRVGSYQRHLPPRLLRQSRVSTGEEELNEESLAFRDVQAPQVGARPRMKGDGGRAACLGEASKLKCPKAESLGEVSRLQCPKTESVVKASRLKNGHAEESAGKTEGLHEEKKSAWSKRVALAEPGDQVSQGRGGEGGGQQGEKFKQLEEQVRRLKIQLEDERMEQKKLLEVLTNVIKGEVPCVSLDKSENILVVQQLQGALAGVESSGTETRAREAPARLKDRNDAKMVVNNLLHERSAEEGSKVNNKVSGGWYVVEKRKKRQTSNPSTNQHHEKVPPATSVRWALGGRGLLPTPPTLSSNFHTRRNLMY